MSPAPGTEPESTAAVVNEQSLARRQHDLKPDERRRVQQLEQFLNLHARGCFRPGNPGQPELRQTNVSCASEASWRTQARSADVRLSLNLDPRDQRPIDDADSAVG